MNLHTYANLVAGCFAKSEADLEGQHMSGDTSNTVVHVHQQKPPGVIRGDEVYTISEFCRRSGLGDYAFRQARGDGLRVIELGKKRFVLGSDWLDFLKQRTITGTNG